MATICLTLNPLKTQAFPSHMNNWCEQDGKTWIPVPYDDQTIDHSEGGDPNESIQQGSDLLDTMITDNITGNTVWVIGHSKGCQVIGRWLIKYGAASGHSTNDLKFVCSGNPVCSLSPGGPDPAQQYLMLPTSQGGFSVIDIARERDGWARWEEPNGNLFITLRNWSGRCNYHPSAKYGDVHLNSVGVPTAYQSTSTVGTTTYYTVD